MEQNDKDIRIKIVLCQVFFHLRLGQAYFFPWVLPVPSLPWSLAPTHHSFPQRLMYSRTFWSLVLSA